MTNLAARLNTSIQLKNQVDAYPTQKSLDNACLEHLVTAQFKIWKLVIEFKINTGETNINLSLRKKYGNHTYIDSYFHNWEPILQMPEGKEFIEWIHSQGLNFRITKKDDGFGRESWEDMEIMLPE